MLISRSLYNSWHNIIYQTLSHIHNLKDNLTRFISIQNIILVGINKACIYYFKRRRISEIFANLFYSCAWH